MPSAADRGERQLPLLWLGVVLTLALALATPLPGALAEHLPACPVKSTVGLPCPSCGTARALLALSELDVLTALAMNPLLFLAGVGFAAGGLAAGGRALVGAPAWRLPRRLPAAIVAVTVAAFVLNWAYLVWRGV